MDIKNSSLKDQGDPIGQNLNKNLSMLMETNGVSLTMLHRNTGIALPTIKRLQIDPLANPTITTLLPIANFFGITVNQLIGNHPIPKVITGYIENKSHWLNIPLTTWELVVAWSNKEIREKTNSFVLADIDVGENPFALTVIEDNWINIPKGALLILNSDIQPIHKDYVVICKAGQTHATLKQIIIDEEKTYLFSLNPYLPPTLLDDSYKLFGVLIQIRKNTRM